MSPAVRAALRGEPIPWAAIGDTPEAVLEAIAAHDVGTLLYGRLRRQASCDWPAALLEPLADAVRADAATEAVRRHELAATLDALADAGVRPMLIKGTPLAYTVYDTPSARPRADTDLLLPRHQIAAAREALRARGYEATVYCDGELLFRQFEMCKVDRFGIEHALDVHWSVSTQTIFAELLSYDELAAEALPVPPLGPSARTAGFVHTLLLACVHPAMHHRNEQRLVWTHDIHLLASRLEPDGWETLTRLAIDRRVAAIVSHSLARACADWGSAPPAATVDALAAVAGEPSAAYLAPDRGWRHETIENVRHLTTWRGRVRLLREIAFPSREYIARSYRLGGAAASFLLPLLYAHRLAVGAGRVLLGRK